MDDTSVSTKVKSKAVTSRTKASRLPLNAELNTTDGAKLHTGEKAVTSTEQEAEKIRDLLARLKDVTHSWPCRMPDQTMPAPFISNNHIIFAFPLGGHVIKNAVTSDKKQNFSVDGMLVIPDVTVTSEKLPIESGNET